MKELKHLQVMGYDLPDLGDISLKKLMTLLNVTTGSCTILNRVPNLRKLGIEIELTPDATEHMCYFAQISHLTKLESFKCVIVNPKYKLDVVSPISSVSSFPCFSFSLKKLSLSGMGYPWKEMRKVVLLPNLKVLKLRCNAFRGPEWEVKENDFPDLRALLIEDIDLVNLKWALGSFKNLQILKIKHCYKLEDLYFGDLPNIWEIEVVDSNPLVECHVKTCAVEDFNILDIFVHSSWKS